MTLACRRAILAVALVCAGSGSSAQDAPSRTAASVDRVGEGLAARALSAGGADALYVLGLLATMDPAARADAWARAWPLEPQRMLVLASRAEACAPRAAFTSPACAAHDPLSRWAARDGENAAPWVLLAGRARQRGDLPAMRANLAHASERSRFDGYRGRGAAAVARVIDSAPEFAGLPEAPFVATALASSRPDAVVDEANALCRVGAPGVGPEVAPACRRLARTMAEHADTTAARQAGLALASGWAADAAERGRLAAERDRLSASALDCHAAKSALLAKLEGTPADRDRARELEAAAVAELATMDETAVCSRLVAKSRVAGVR